jgi:glycosyltransferase involved in cell wall biosynthesis
LKVLQVIPAVAARYGGPSEAIVSLTRELMEQGVDVCVATTNADGPDELAVQTGELTEWRSLPVRFFPRRFGESYKYSPALAQWLNQSVMAFDIVHIHAIFSHSSVTAARACRRWQVPYILRPLGSLDPAPLARHSIRKRIFHSLWGDAMLQGACAIQYGTSREMTLAESRFPSGRGFVAPPGVEQSSAAPDSEPADQATRCALPATPYVLFLGRIDPIKRLESLIDAFAAATGEAGLSRWQLAIGGDGKPEYVEALRRRAQQRCREGRIHFCGWLDGAAKRKALAGAELVALTSAHENFGRATAEAMLAGTPVVVSEEVFLAEQIREVQAGWVAGDEPGALMHTLRDAMSNAADRAERGRAAKKLASGQFDIRSTTKAIVEKYRTIVAARAGKFPH